MFGLGLGLGLSLTRRLGAGEPVVPATYIPAELRASLVGCYSLTKLVPDYSGPVAAACAISEPAGTPTTGSRDIYTRVDQTPDLTDALAAWGETFNYWKMYDQSGGGHHTDAQTVSNQRGIRARQAVGKDNWYSNTFARFAIPSSLTIASRQNLTIVSVAAGNNQTNSGASLALVGLGISSKQANLVSGSMGITGLGSGFSISYLGQAQLPTFIGLSSSPSAVKLFRNSETRTASAWTDAVDLAGGHLGFNAQPHISQTHRHYADLVFNRTLTDSEMAELYAALQVIFGIAERQSQIVYAGDSIQFGQSSTENKSKQFYMEGSLTGSPYQINFGRPGAAAGEMLADYSQANMNLLFRSEFAKNIWVCNIGTNSLASNTTAATLQTHIQTLASRAITAGFKPIFETIIPRTTLTSPQEAERVTYNSWLVANAASFGADVIDYRADTIALADGVHPISIGGYDVMAARALPVLNAWL